MDHHPARFAVAALTLVLGLAAPSAQAGCDSIDPQALRDDPNQTVAVEFVNDVALAWPSPNLAQAVSLPARASADGQVYCQGSVWAYPPEVSRTRGILRGDRLTLEPTFARDGLDTPLRDSGHGLYAAIALSRFPDGHTPREIPVLDGFDLRCLSNTRALRIEDLLALYGDLVRLCVPTSH